MYRWVIHPTKARPENKSNNDTLLSAYIPCTPEQKEKKGNSTKDKHN